MRREILYASTSPPFRCRNPDPCAADLSAERTPRNRANATAVPANHVQKPGPFTSP